MKLKKLPEPIGKFIIDNANGTPTNTGTYYHYSEVCNLLNLYKQQLGLIAVVQAEPEVCAHPKDAIKHSKLFGVSICYLCGKKVKQTEQF